MNEEEEEKNSISKRENLNRTSGHFFVEAICQYTSNWKRKPAIADAVAMIMMDPAFDKIMIK